MSAERPNSVRENVRFPKREPEPEQFGVLGVFGVRGIRNAPGGVRACVLCGIEEDHPVLIEMPFTHFCVYPAETRFMVNTSDRELGRAREAEVSR